MHEHSRFLAYNMNLLLYIFDVQLPRFANVYRLLALRNWRLQRSLDPPRAVVFFSSEHRRNKMPLNSCRFSILEVSYGVSTGQRRDGAMYRRIVQHCPVRAEDLQLELAGL